MHDEESSPQKQIIKCLETVSQKTNELQISKGHPVKGKIEQEFGKPAGRTKRKAYGLKDAVRGISDSSFSA